MGLEISQYTEPYLKEDGVLFEDGNTYMLIDPRLNVGFGPDPDSITFFGEAVHPLQIPHIDAEHYITTGRINLLFTDERGDEYLFYLEDGKWDVC